MSGLHTIKLEHGVSWLLHHYCCQFLLNLCPRFPDKAVDTLLKAVPRLCHAPRVFIYNKDLRFLPLLKGEQNTCPFPALTRKPWVRAWIQSAQSLTAQASSVSKYQPSLAVPWVCVITTLWEGNNRNCLLLKPFVCPVRVRGCTVGGLQHLFLFNLRHWTSVILQS